ncbi:Plasmodium vivax Vir protein, putative [Plasmodium ovale]|uniref:Plasmodium vivax Vir protein, putative n=1 Tax=Plasmodium ovale TaxID=36330 RepID=A0A1C3KI30_PLAOA|nr:Plasmodium vivax Vir protein, putative [Plasmodium ovale]
MVDETTALKDLDSLIFDYKLDNINVKNIEFAHNTIHLNGEELKEKRCEDFIYWMHYNVNKVNKNTEQHEINKIIKELITVWSEVNEKLKSNHVKESYLCDISNINIPLNFIKLEQKKKMSDYCQNFDTIHTKLTNPNKLNCEVYYDYFMKTKKAYDEVFVECHNNSGSSNCPKICVRKKNNPKLILDNLRCDKIPKPVEEEKRITIKECNAEKDVIQSELKQALLDASNPAFNYSDPRSVFLILFTFWGIFLTLFFFSWIRNNLLKKKIARENFDEEIDDEPIFDYSGSVNANMENVEYNISYNSDWSPSQ